MAETERDRPSITSRSAIVPAHPALAALAALAVLGTLAKPSFARPFDPQGQDWEGLSQLVFTAQTELGTAHVAVAKSLPLDKLDRKDGLLLVHPERPLDVEELSAFMQAGGRVVLFDDYGTGEDLLTPFGIRRTPMPTRPAEMLRANPSLAIAEPAGEHPTVRDVAHVVTNHATGLDHSGLSPLLVVHGDGEPDVLLALAGAVGRGRLVAVGDASIPMNAMMRYPGNRALSRALVRYATDDDAWGKRGGTLYIVANDFRTTGTFGSTSEAGAMAGAIRHAVLEGVATLRREGLPPMGSYLAALAVGLGVVAWTSVRVGKTNRPEAPRFVRPVPVERHGGIAGHAAALGSAAASRALAMVELKNALEETAATRLGLDRVPPHDELVTKIRASGLLDPRESDALSALLRELGRIPPEIAGPPRASGSLGRIPDTRVVAVSVRVRELIDKLARAP